MSGDVDFRQKLRRCHQPTGSRGDGRYRGAVVYRSVAQSTVQHYQGGMHMRQLVARICIDADRQESCIAEGETLSGDLRDRILVGLALIHPGKMTSNSRFVKDDDQPIVRRISYGEQIVKICLEARNVEIGCI